MSIVSSALSRLLQIPVAHRGLHGPVPENTFVAVAAAFEHGYPVECDVRTSSDGHWFLFHDSELSRLTGQSGVFGSVASSEVRSLRIGGTEPVPGLEAVLAMVPSELPLLVEVKDGGTDSSFERLVELFGGSADRVAVQSFDVATVKALSNRLQGIIPIGWITADPVPVPDQLQGLIDFVAVDYRALGCVRARGLFSGLPLLAWTVRNRAELERVRNAGANGIFEGFTP